MATNLHCGLAWLVGQLDAVGRVIDESTAERLLAEVELDLSELNPFIEESREGYTRRCVVRREGYELLVLTWRPGQGSPAHDHAGSLSALKVARGSLTEQLFAPGCDGQVRETTQNRLAMGEVLVDSGLVIHSLGNDAAARDNLVTVHVYSPPLPEIRRYAVAPTRPAALFERRPEEKTPVVAIIGGGFTGTMTFANLLRLGSQAPAPLHVVMIDRQPAFGEGIAYRTNDSRHLLNVPAGRMSAWPDRPDDFLRYAQAHDSSVRTGDFLPRKMYGSYVRQTLLHVAEASPTQLSGEMIRAEATSLQAASPGWIIQTSSGRKLQADAVVVTAGHRPPDDPLHQRWSGPRHRFVADPWAALVLGQIGPDEPVLLLGSGLTAMDAILTLHRRERSAPIIIVSRHGLMPLPHRGDPKPAADVSGLVAGWLDPSRLLTARRLATELRREVDDAVKAGFDWRQVVDGLRPSIPKLWGRLSTAERKRFIGRVRPFWEVHRHRMAPEVAEKVRLLQENGRLKIFAGTLISATGHGEGAEVTFACGTGRPRQTVRVSWVVNCTGPGVHHRHSTHPILRPLLEAGTLQEDDLHLGLHTNAEGQAIDGHDRVVPTLLVAGTLRKCTLWESTAVPELRQQAQAIAETVVTKLLPAIRAGSSEILQ